MVVSRGYCVLGMIKMFQVIDIKKHIRHWSDLVRGACSVFLEIFPFSALQRGARISFIMISTKHSYDKI